jgi:hypothetical protein
MSQSASIHSKQISILVCLAYTLNHKTQSLVNTKVSTKHLKKHTKIHLKQLHAKDGTLVWFNGLDALQYLQSIMKTYLCLKTISFVHILNFEKC